MKKRSMMNGIIPRFKESKNLLFPFAGLSKVQRIRLQNSWAAVQPIIRDGGFREPCDYTKRGGFKKITKIIRMGA